RREPKTLREVLVLLFGLRIAIAASALPAPRAMGAGEMPAGTPEQFQDQDQEERSDVGTRRPARGTHLPAAPRHRVTRDRPRRHRRLGAARIRGGGSLEGLPVNAQPRAAGGEIPCPFLYAGGRRCNGRVVAVEVFKTDLKWRIEPDGSAHLSWDGQ